MTTRAADRIEAVPAVGPAADPAARYAAGRSARHHVPFDAQAVLAPTEGRPDPVELLAEQATTRVPELVPIRYGRMLASPLRSSGAPP